MKQKYVETLSLCFVLVSVASCGGGESTTPAPSLAGPVGLTGTPGSGQVVLKWTAVTGAASYNVFASATSGTPGKLIGTSSTTSYIDTAAVNGTAYYYTVAAQASGADGTPSAQSTAVIPVAVNVQKVPNTGQTIVYVAGDNGTHASVNPMSYTDNGDSTVTDNVTGLMWQKQDNGSSMNWFAAVPYCEGLSLGGHDDWRLPSEKELHSIVNYGALLPAITASVFPNTQSASYFSSTTYVAAPSFAWLFPFYDATALWGHKSAPGYARCVRLGQSQPVQSFNDNGDGTVTDNVTRIMWQKQDDGSDRNWENSVKYCAALSLLGHKDWRLPNIKELNSIVDLTTYNPAISPVYFSTASSSFYWSSTSYSAVFDPTNTSAWGIAYYDGSVYSNDKSFIGRARCARDM